MDALYRKSDRLLANTSMTIVREKMGEVHWNAQLISIMGPNYHFGCSDFSINSEYFAIPKHLQEVQNVYQFYVS